MTRHQRYFIDRVHLVTDGAEGNRFTWNYNDDVPDPHTEDAAHGDLDVNYMSVLRSAFDRLNAVVAPVGEPIVLDDALLRQFANSFLQQIARPNEIDSGGNLRGDLNGRSATDLGKRRPITTTQSATVG